MFKSKTRFTEWWRMRNINKWTGILKFLYRVLFDSIQFQQFVELLPTWINFSSESQGQLSYDHWSWAYSFKFSRFHSNWLLYTFVKEPRQLRLWDMYLLSTACFYNMVFFIFQTIKCFPLSLVDWDNEY